jgi:hypothetical protein
MPQAVKLGPISVLSQWLIKTTSLCWLSSQSDEDFEARNKDEAVTMR